jgi:hypothetical protein
MDGDRVVAAGASYGGYMINWMHGQPFASSFRAFVCHDGNLDERMAYFDTEELWFPEWEKGGTPWENPEGYERFNPIDHVQNWHVPTLVIHGALDYRVVYTQGLSTFTALRRQGVPGAPALLPGREPLGAQAPQLDPVARRGHGLDHPLDPGLTLTVPVADRSLRASVAQAPCRGVPCFWARVWKTA